MRVPPKIPNLSTFTVALLITFGLNTAASRSIANDEGPSAREARSQIADMTERWKRLHEKMATPGRSGIKAAHDELRQIFDGAVAIEDQTSKLVGARVPELLRGDYARLYLSVKGHPAPPKPVFDLNSPPPRVPVVSGLPQMTPEDWLRKNVNDELLLARDDLLRLARDIEIHVDPLLVALFVRVNEIDSFVDDHQALTHAELSRLEAKIVSISAELTEIRRSRFRSGLGLIELPGEDFLASYRSGEIPTHYGTRQKWMREGVSAGLQTLRRGIAECARKYHDPANRN